MVSVLHLGILRGIVLLGREVLLQISVVEHNGLVVSVAVLVAHTRTALLCGILGITVNLACGHEGIVPVDLA